MFCLHHRTPLASTRVFCNFAQQLNSTNTPSISTTATIAILTGTTASGKTSLALEFCRSNRSNGSAEIEIVNADSLLVYRGFNIGTAKPSREELTEFTHHLIDVCDPDENYNAARFVADAHAAIAAIEKRGHRALIVGGTGFYLKALLYGLWDAPKTDPKLRAELEALSSEALAKELEDADPETAQATPISDRYRMIRAIEIFRLSSKRVSELKKSENAAADPRFRLLVADRSIESLEKRISERVTQMLEAGLVDETETLRKSFPNSRALQSVGYFETLRHLDRIAPEGRPADFTREGLKKEVVLATRQLAKRQRTWFRSEKKSEFFDLDTDREKLLDVLRQIY